MQRPLRMLLLLPLPAACSGGERSACGGGVTRPDKPAPVLECMIGLAS